MKSLRSLILPLLACSLLGCATTRLQAPDVTLAGASLTSGDMFSQLFRLRLHVHNPNDRPLSIRSVEYVLYLEGDAFSEGTSVAPFVVPASGDQEFDMDVRTNFVSSILRLQSRLDSKGSDEVQYKFEGRLTLDSAMTPKLRFNQSGTIRLPLRR